MTATIPARCYRRAVIAGLAGWTDDEVRQATLEAPGRAFVPMPDLEVVERPGWLQLIAPRFRDGGLNGVWRSILADDDADAVIAATIATYAARDLRFRWVVAPDSRPLDLAERLTRHGLQGEPGRGMACATASPAITAATIADGITIERVDLDSVTIFDHVMGAGWEIDPAPFAHYHRALLTDPDRASSLYLARWQGEPAATAAQMRIGRSTYLIGGVVLPAFRGHGLYRALVVTRLREAAAAGLALAVTHARVATSAPILERLGFSTVAEVTSFRNR